MTLDINPSLIDAIPTGELAPDRGDKGAGKVLSMTPGAIRARRHRAKKGTTTPRATTPKRSAASRSRAPRSLYPEIAATLSMANMILTMTPLGSRPERPDDAGNILPARIGDELDDAEITLLARALDSQCQRSPRFRKQVERVLGVGAGGQLITVISLIATRRAARHGLAPEMLDPMLGAMMQGGDLAALGSFAPPDTETRDAETGEQAPRAEAPEGFDGI